MWAYVFSIDNNRYVIFSHFSQLIIVWTVLTVSQFWKLGIEIRELDSQSIEPLSHQTPTAQPGLVG